MLFLNFVMLFQVRAASRPHAGFVSGRIAAFFLFLACSSFSHARPGATVPVADASPPRFAENFERLEFPEFDAALPVRAVDWTDAEKKTQRAAGTRLRGELAAAVASGARVYDIPRGIYRFGATDIPLELSGVSGLDVKGDGAEFVLEGTQPAVRLERCRGVAIRGITVDRDPLPYAQFEVVSYDAASKRLAARFFEGCDPRSFPDSKGHLQFFHRDGTWVGHVFIGFASLRVSDEGERFVEFEGVETHEPSPWLQPGILGVTALRGGFHCIRTIECADITVEDFTNYGGMQIIFGELGDGDFAFRRIKNITRPGTNRLLGGAFGLMTWVGGNMRLEDSVFCRSNDDALDMVSWNSVVYRQDAPTEIIARPMCDTPYRVGDTLQFHDRTTFNPLGAPKVLSVEKIDDPAMSADAADVARKLSGYIGGLHEFSCVKITLDAPVTVKPGDAIANETSFRLDSFTLKNCFFHDIFCRVLVHGLKEGLIEGNALLRCGMAAICVDNEQRNWAEGPCSRNVVIRKNVIKDSPFSPYMGYGHQLSGAISVGFTQDDRTGTIPNTGQSTRNITIEDNRIINPMYAGILVKNTDGLKITGNTIENPVSRVNTARRDSDPAEAYYGSPQDAAIFLYACRNVTLQGNVVKERGPHCRREVAMIPGPAREKVAATPVVRSVSTSAIKGLEVQLDWKVAAAPPSDWRQFLLLVDGAGEVRAQAEEMIDPGTSTWKPGRVPTAPLKLVLPPGTEGTFDLRAGLCRDNGRAELDGRGNRELSYLVGRVEVAPGGRAIFTGPQSDNGIVEAAPAVKSVESISPNRFRMAWEWNVGSRPNEDWTVFVHFTDENGDVKFQGDFQPDPPTSSWLPGTVVLQPSDVGFPAGLTGTFDIKAGLYQVGGTAARIDGPVDGANKVIVGQVKIEEGKVEFLPAP